MVTVNIPFINKMCNRTSKGVVNRTSNLKCLRKLIFVSVIGKEEIFLNITGVMSIKRVKWLS